MLLVSEIALIASSAAGLIGGVMMWLEYKSRRHDRRKISRLDVLVPTERELRDHEYQKEMAQKLLDLDESRRQWLNWMADEAYRLDAKYINHAGEVLDNDNMLDIDEVYANDDGKWLEYFTKTVWEKPVTSEIGIKRLHLLSLAQRVQRQRLGNNNGGNAAPALLN